MSKFDFGGWATKNNLKCSDGRTIMKDAFKHNDGNVVPLVWNHDHTGPFNVLGHALLENRDEGVYAYCKLNESEAGEQAKILIKNGDVKALSIYANRLKQQGGNVLHGEIREVSLVLAGANPGAYIDIINLSHSDDSEEGECEGCIRTFDTTPIYLNHADQKEEKGKEQMAEDEKQVKDNKPEDEETVADVFNTLTEKQKTAVYAVIGQALEDAENDEEDGGEEQMKHNVFDQDVKESKNVLTHADQTNILNLAKATNVGSLQAAISIYAEENSLAHGIDDIEQLFPDYKDAYPGAPERITNDLDWTSVVISKMHKNPYSRIRTRQADTRGSHLKAKGYKKGEKKQYIGNITLMHRTTDPQTIYVKDKLNRDDIIDITDFDVVNYMYLTLKEKLYEEIALAVMIGDGREEGDPDKIYETHVRSILNDDELYTIHRTVDFEATKLELQGNDTSLYFGENFIFSEAIVNNALYAREGYKGKGALDYYCTPHALNRMLLARDRNGNRIYKDKADLARALNVENIYTAEQFEGVTRTTKDGKVKKLIGIFVNLGNYSAGSTKGGEITKFNQFDIDYNQEKYLLETRMSGALTRIKSAIVLEEDVEEAAE